MKKHDVDHEALKQIESMKKRMEMVHKTYGFMNNKNPRIISEYWFQNTPEGLTLFLIFFSQACQYAKCTGCNLPSQMSEHHVNFVNLMKQTHSVFHNILSDKEKHDVRKIIISNNGSVMDQETFSTTALIYLIAKINMECRNISTVTLETRPEYVEEAELEIIGRSLREGKTPTALELAIGFEAFDDKIRNEQFNKGLSLEKVDHLAEMMAKKNNDFMKHYYDHFAKMKLKCYFMLKPIPGMSEEDAMQDIRNAIDYLDGLSKKYDLEINMHLNPTYVAKGTMLETAFIEGNFTPPLLESVRNVVLYAEDKKVTLYVGLNDEGLAVPGGSFIRPDNEEEMKLMELLNQFNATQNYELLKIGF